MRITAVAEGVPPRVANFKAPPTPLLLPLTDTPRPISRPTLGGGSAMAVTPLATVPLTGACGPGREVALL